MVPQHTFGDVDVMVGHTLVILRIDTMHVYKCVTHLVLTAIDVGTDDAVDALITHDVRVYGHALFVSFARNVGQFLFRPQHNALMTVGIEWLHKTGAGFYRAVHKNLEPVGLHACGSVFLCVTGFGQHFIRIHPAVQLGGQTQDNMQVTGLVYLLSSLEDIFIKEVGGVTVNIHRIAL